MAEVSIISDPQDRSPRRTTRTISDALNKLSNWGVLPTRSRLELVAKSAPGRSPLNAALRFKSTKGDDALFALPFSRGCLATGTLGNRFYLALDRLDGAEVDCDGNIKLQDGTYVHAVSFDVLPVYFKLPELEETIVYLIIRYLRAEAQCIRNEYGFVVGIDYAALPDLRVPNVKALTRYVNANISKIPRSNGRPPFKKLRPSTVHRTLDLVYIQKARGRPKNQK